MAAMRTWWIAVLCWGAIAAPALAQVDRPIRIGVVESTLAATLSAPVPAALYDGSQVLFHAQPGEEVGVALAGGAIAVTGIGSASVSAAGPLRWRPEVSGTDAKVTVGPHVYRGELEVLAMGSGLTVVDELSLEDYLYGVVPAEAIPSWGIESLKAQAVAARTYAVSHLGQFASLGYDLKATVASQAYGGAAVEKPSTTRAVNDTKGQILMYQGKPIEAYYSDSAGGYTESCGDAWGHDIPYLQAVPDFDQESPRYLWEATLASDRVAKSLSKLGHDIGDLQDLQITQRSFSGRVKRARLVGRTGTLEVTGEKIRFAFGLRSTYFNVARQPDGSLAFAGRGWGHGVGMSQWGAKAMADMGYGFDQILAHYYPSSQLGPWDGTRGTQAVVR